MLMQRKNYYYDDGLIKTGYLLYRITLTWKQQNSLYRHIYRLTHTQFFNKLIIKVENTILNPFIQF